MPLPLYFDMTDFYGNPEEYLKPDEEDTKDMIAEAMRQNEAMMKKAEEKAGKKG